MEQLKEFIFLKYMWCWWCCHPFESIPLSMPLRHDVKRNIFSTNGTYCSWSCMKSHAIEKYGCNRGGIICGNITMMRRKMYNHLGGVKPAPYRYRLAVFGGDMTIEQFRQNQTQDGNDPVSRIECKPHTDNLIPIVSNTKKMNEIKNANYDNNTLKLKRTKPLKRSHNNLESALGLIITPKS